MKPNFFIIGAPKCGTTALASYLSEHENIFMSDPKEPHFLADDFPHYKNSLPDLQSYEGLFSSAKDDNVLAIGEASVWYLYSEQAVQNIKAYSPSAKLIIMFRKPSDVMRSLHKQLLWTLDEDESDLDLALEKMSSRERGENLPEKCREPKFLQYLKVVHFGQQLEKVYSHFPREQVKVIFFDDFLQDAHLVYSQTLAFLGLEDDGRSEFPKINERKKNKSKILADFTHRPPRLLVSLIRAVKSVLGIRRFGIMGKIRKINSESIAKTDRDQFFFSQEISAMLNADIDKLEMITNHDLSHWKEIN